MSCAPYRTAFAGRVVLLAAVLCTLGAGPVEPPVVLVHGFDSHPDIWRGTERVLREAGRTSVLIHWRPAVPGARSPETAVSVLLPAIGDGLEAAGYPRDAPFDVVTHSMGGLLMRLLLEHTELHGDLTLPARVGSLAMLSPPHQGARTGIAGIACGTYRDPLWRDIVCDLKAGSALLERLGSTKPEGVPTRYLSIGVATGAPFIPVPLYDGDGDGRPAGHDNAVMAESGALPGEGSSFVIWRGWDRHDHFNASCSGTVNQWVLEFVVRGVVPTPAKGRVRGGDACKGVSKSVWRAAHGYE
jgi:pimeloyl-ACP methyl ester carboxylesterase